MASSSAMRQLEERHVATVVESLVWCNKMDLLALSNIRGEVSLHRLTWQRVWVLPPPKESITVTAMAWRPDGKVLAVAYSNQKVLLVDVENAEVLNTTNMGHDVTCLVWVEEEEPKGDRLPTVANQYKDVSKTFLPSLPSLSRSFGPMSKGTEENAEDSKKIDEQKLLNILMIGTKDGLVQLNVFGIFPCGSVNLNEHVGGKPCEVMCLDISRRLDVLAAIVAVESGEEYKLGTVLVHTPVLATHAQELQLLAKQHGHILSLQAYMTQTMASITEAWENILMEMDSKLAKYSLNVPEGSVSADFLELLMMGNASVELEHFLLHDLTEKGLKKLGHSIELSYSNIQKLVLKHLQAVGQNILYHLSELKGMAQCTESFGALGLSEQMVVSAMTAAAAFMTKATEVQQVIDNSMKNYKAFFRWLYVAILRLSDERLPPDITKIRQTELTFIAEFLENFDAMGVKENADASTDTTPQAGGFKLERLGQYLVEEDLKIIVDKKSNPWIKFLQEKDMVHPALVPRFEKMSLVQQYMYLKTAIESLFNEPDQAIRTQFTPMSAFPFYTVASPSHVHVSCATEPNERILMVSFVHHETQCENLYFLQFSLKNPSSFKPTFSKFNFLTQKENEKHHKILDLQFFSEEILSILLEDRTENRTAVFVQFPLVVAREGCNPMFGPLAEMPVRDAVRLLEVNTLRPMENMVACRLAVSGTRKVAVVLSESRRRVRLFEMEVDVEEEDEEDEAMDAANTTKDSTENNASVDADHTYSVSTETQTFISMLRGSDIIKQ